MNRNWRLYLALGVVLSGAAATGALAQPTAASLGNVDHGQSLYQAKGCYECHGYAAQGAMGVGPPLVSLHFAATGVRPVPAPPVRSDATLQLLGSERC